MEQEKFTIEEIRNYILSQDSLGDVLYNLKAEKIIEANDPDTIFRKCTLTDRELIEKVDKITDEIYKSASKRVPPMSIPARPDHDYDLLIGELILRFGGLIKEER